MDSSVTKHGARWDGQRGSWKVSWLRSRLLDRDQAVTAMTIAEVVATTAATAMCVNNGPLLLHPGNWATEPGLHRSEVLIHAAADLSKDREPAW
ncbi:hypothetical protein [Kutzneria buriramensis]|uniref:Uncharacterized protein n=1 Tax=Kutzneria buriramensis TaxID=1045776 RepID=A0A3E0I9F7_9PSEU|nr:hypothetical protein [Kutzneria buriramensis]REH55241.1 hypothetical protein BCF44_101258 [Kutzneria buriramensis]